MTNANSSSVAETAFSPRPLRSATGTGSVVFGRICQYAQLLFYLHLHKVDERQQNCVLTLLSANALCLFRRSFFEIANCLFGFQAEIEVP